MMNVPHVGEFSLTAIAWTVPSACPPKQRANRLRQSQADPLPPFAVEESGRSK